MLRSMRKIRLQFPSTAVVLSVFGFLLFVLCELVLPLSVSVILFINSVKLRQQ